MLMALARYTADWPAAAASLLCIQNVLHTVIVEAPLDAPYHSAFPRSAVRGAF